MTRLTARDRYEVDGNTIIYIPEEWITQEQLDAVINREKVTFSARNEQDGSGHGRRMERSIMIPVGYTVVPSGIHVTLTLDIQSLPVSRRELDGRQY